MPTSAIPGGRLSVKRSSGIVTDIQRNTDGTDAPGKQITHEQDISGSPPAVGNEVRLLQDGPQTYQAMFATMVAAKNHVNLETFVVDDSDVGRQFADVLIAQQSRCVQAKLIYESVGAVPPVAGKRGRPRKRSDKVHADKGYDCGS